ncbi:TPA: protein sok, partial [Escherichia coli]|nr:protein sok [Escherichia coli]HBY2349146.1 protein sok [Klebsiella pneumoniae]HAG7197286.1 protein sok [Escherichia coli]HAG7927704.1 protein sok [Escherichia coli]HAG8976932.1 protein sok [Escherichia coli]
MWTRHRDASWWLMKINLLRGYL